MSEPRSGQNGPGRDGGTSGGRDRGGRQRPPARQRSDRQRSSQRPAERARRTDKARLTAYTAMREIADGAYANLVLPALLREKHLTGRDAGFTTELVYGATRLRGLYDEIVSVAADRPVDKIDPRVIDTLRLGVHQLLGMRVATHAAVDETVALARQVNGAGPAGFVNAVLRRVSERERDEWLEVVTRRAADQLEALATRTSHPLWIVKALRAALIGHGAVEPSAADTALAELLEADNSPAKVALVARPGLSTVEELVEAGAVASAVSPVGAILVEGDPGAIPAVRRGRAAVQDEGSQLIALALANAQTSGPAAESERWLDLCAGPGGKAGLLAALAVQRQIPFIANEVSPHRADLVRQTLAAARAAADAAGSTLEVRTADGREVGAEEPAMYSRVLIDAPCTGLGALRRRPEARWRRTAGNVTALAGLQRQLLVSGIEATAPGGLIAYATCSPHLNETRFVVGDVTKRRDDVEIVDARPLFVDAEGRQLEHLGEGPFVQLWPHVHGTDGMFFALLRRR
jgi:16S rRNA (cytosine967-C5)-methyltransferase